jgi:hypothetical protein
MVHCLGIGTDHPEGNAPMIVIYANWTGNALAAGGTIDEAYAKLTRLDCEPGTLFGADVTELTALEVPPDAKDVWMDYLYQARKRWPAVAGKVFAKPEFNADGSPTKTFQAALKAEQS